MEILYLKHLHFETLVNGTPGVGHIKAGIHLVCNDEEGAKQTMRKRVKTNDYFAF